MLFAATFRIAGSEGEESPKMHKLSTASAIESNSCCPSFHCVKKYIEVEFSKPG
jgi:hypothetical protein